MKELGAYPLRVAVQLASLRQPLKRALQTAARIGARAVEFDARRELRPQETTQTALRQIRKLLDDLNLRVSAVGFQSRYGFGTAENLDRRIAAAQAAMKLAQQLGATVLVCRVGQVPQDQAGQPWQLMTDALTGLGLYGHRVGALLAARTGSESGPDLARLLNSLPADLLGVDLCPGSLLRNGYSVRDALAALGDRVLHVHATDGTRDDAMGHGVETQLGRGTADYSAIVGALEQVQYRGWFTIQRSASADPVAEIADAVAYLGRL